jgi:hypothetical protein
MGLATTAALCSPVSAGVLTFTFAPNAASPSLAGAGSAFTANGMSLGNYLTAVVQPDFSFVVHQIEPVTGFTLNGAPVAAPGLGSSYGLYIDITGTGNQPPGSITYSTLNVALKADPGNLNGLPVATATGTGFTNTGATGAADDITLATGSMSSATLAFNPATGVRKAHFVETFAPAPGEVGFFAAPPFNASDFLYIDLTTNPNTFTSVSGPNGTTVNFVNGAFGTAQLVPEPASMVLLSSAVAGLFMTRRRAGLLEEPILAAAIAGDLEEPGREGSQRHIQSLGRCGQRFGAVAAPVAPRRRREGHLRPFLAGG